MFCSNCGTQNADGVKFCSNCGNPMPTPKPVEETVVASEPTPVAPVYNPPVVEQPVAPAPAPVYAPVEPVAPAPAPAPEKPKKKNNNIIIIAIVAVIAVAAIVVGILFGTGVIGGDNKKKEEETTAKKTETTTETKDKENESTVDTPTDEKETPYMTIVTDLEVIDIDSDEQKVVKDVTIEIPNAKIFEEYNVKQDGINLFEASVQYDDNTGNSVVLLDFQGYVPSDVEIVMTLYYVGSECTLDNFYAMKYHWSYSWGVEETMVLATVFYDKDMNVLYEEYLNPNAIYGNTCTGYKYTSTGYLADDYTYYDNNGNVIDLGEYEDEIIQIINVYMTMNGYFTMS